MDIEYNSSNLVTTISEYNETNKMNNNKYDNLEVHNMTAKDIVINRSVRINQNTGKLMVTKAYAEANLSKSALKYAEKTNTHYLWDWGKSAYIVIYELPRLFNFSFPEVMRYLINYCMPYVQENNLNDNVIYSRYMDNYNRKLKA